MQFTEKSQPGVCFHVAFSEFPVSFYISYPGDRGSPHNRPPLLLWFPHIKLVILKILKRQGSDPSTFSGKIEHCIFFLLLIIQTSVQTDWSHDFLRTNWIRSPVPGLRRHWPPALTRSSHTLLLSSYLERVIKQDDLRLGHSVSCISRCQADSFKIYPKPCAMLCLATQCTSCWFCSLLASAITKSRAYRSIWSSALPAGPPPRDLSADWTGKRSRSRPLCPACLSGCCRGVEFDLPR